MRVVYAYLDAGTGSLLLQAVLGGVAGLVVLFKTMRHRLFKRRQEPSSSTEPATELSVEGDSG